MAGNSDNIDKAIADLQGNDVRLQAQIIVLKFLVHMTINALSKTDPDAPRRIVEMFSRQIIQGPEPRLTEECKVAFEHVIKELARSFNIEL